MQPSLNFKILVQFAQSPPTRFSNQKDLPRKSHPPRQCIQPHHLRFRRGGIQSVLPPWKLIDFEMIDAVAF